jgi:hypothetical protein
LLINDVVYAEASIRFRSIERFDAALARTGITDSIRATGRLSQKRKGPQLALEPLNGQGIAGYVPGPELWARSW